VASGDLRLKGSVKEVGLARDSDKYDSFSVTIGIAIKTEGKVNYEEAERLSAKFRREYLGKDVEFLAVSVPCPYCDKVLNSEGGLKLHIRQVHPERAGEVAVAPKATTKTSKKPKAKKEKTPKKTRARPKDENPTRKTVIKAKRPKTVAARRPKHEAHKPAPEPLRQPPATQPMPIRDAKTRQLTLT